MRYALPLIAIMSLFAFVGIFSSYQSQQQFKMYLEWRSDAVKTCLSFSETIDYDQCIQQMGLVQSKSILK